MLNRRALSIAVAAALSIAGTAAQAASFSFSDNTEWGLGSSTSVVTDPPPNTGNGHLRLPSNILTPFDHIWVALSGRGSVARIDTNHTEADGVVTVADSAAGAGAVLGEYLSAPAGRATNPSRTTVDQNGDVWVGNRNESAGGLGSVVKISAAPAAATSSGLWNGSTFDRLAWTNAGSADDNGGTSTAADTAITHYVRTAGTNNRSLSVDAQNDLWVGGFGNKTYQQLDGTTGAPKTPPAPFTLNTPTGGGGYGSLIDGNGVLWAAGWNTPYVSRYDTNTNTDLGDVGVGGPSYGLGIDSQGNVWNSHFQNGTISKISNDGSTVMTFVSGGFQSRGVAVTADDNVWVANSASNTVSRLANDGTLLGTIAVGALPTGVAVDSNGKVWVTNFSSNSVMRIDPLLGAIGGVDLTIELGAGATPYNYSDMTGTVSVGTTNPQGFWTYTADGGSADTFWDRIFWNEELEGAEPAGTGILVEARAANSLAGLLGMAWTSFNSGELIGLTGKFLDVRATLTRTGGGVGAATPVLSDLRFATATATATVPEPLSLALVGAGMLLVGAGRTRRHRQARAG